MIIFPTTRPVALRNAFDKAIKDGNITTWEKDSDGDYFHRAAQWTKRAWLRPEIVDGQSLSFRIIFKEKEDDKRIVYAFHSARIVEAFINHFPMMFTPHATITPNHSGNDVMF